jgi:cytidylate kinase
MSEEGLELAIPKQGPVISIDGPAGTGKSTAARRLSDQLGFTHVDTGALYRAIAFLALERSPMNEQEVIALAREVHLQFQRNPSKNPANRILANGRDLTDFIRTPEVTQFSSRVSAIPRVRAALLGLQRRLGCRGKAILEGRDIGTVIFPDADIKFFLSAQVDERVKRRLIELEGAGADTPSFEEVKKQMLERDLGDSSRLIAPLRKPQDAIELDTSLMTLDEVVESMFNWTKKVLVPQRQ